MSFERSRWYPDAEKTQTPARIHFPLAIPPSSFLPSSPPPLSPHIHTHAGKFRVAFWRDNLRTPVLFILMTNSGFCSKSSDLVRGVNWVNVYICFVLIPFPPPPQPLSIIVPLFNVACAIFLLKWTSVEKCFPGLLNNVGSERPL